MIVDLKSFTIGTKVRTVFCVQSRKKVTFGLKLLLMETEQASLRNKLSIGRSILLFYKFPLNKDLSQNMGLFDLKIVLALTLLDMGVLACISPFVGGREEEADLTLLIPLKPYETELVKQQGHTHKQLNWLKTLWKFDFADVSVFVQLSFEQLSFNSLQ